MKKIYAICLLVCLLAASLSSCKITAYQPTESSQSDESVPEASQPPVIDTDEAAIVYGDAVIGKRLFKLVAALQKGIAEYAYKLAVDIDFEANPEYWDYEISEGVTFADSTLQAAIERCKELAVIKQLCDNAGIAEPADELKQAYFDKLSESYDSKSDFVKVLNDLGVTEEEVYRYYSICARGITLKEQLTGEGGALELSEREADIWFDEYVEQNYVKADLFFIGFYDQDGKTQYIDPDITDAEALEYFDRNYVKCKYVKYNASAEALADSCLEDIKNGMPIEQKLGESSDSESVMLLHYGDAFYDDIAKLNKNECAKITEDGDIYIVQCVAVSRSDVTTAIKNYCLWRCTCDKLTRDSELFLDDVKNGRVTFETASGGTHIGSVVFDIEEYGEILFKTVKYDNLVGECDVACTDKGIYVFIKEDVTGSRSDEREQAISDHIDDIFNDYVSSFIDTAENFDDITGSVDIKEIRSLLLI